MRAVFWASTILLAVATFAPTLRGDQPYQSPGEVYTSVQAAIRNSDCHALGDCLTADSMEVWAWATAITAHSWKNGHLSESDAARSIDAVFSRHGISSQKLVDAVFKLRVTAEEKRGEVLSEALQGVKHKPRFIFDAYVQMLELDKRMAAQLAPIEIVKWMQPDFVGMTIDGDQASAKVPQPEGSGPPVREVLFRKGNNGWLVHFPMNFPTAGTPAENDVRGEKEPRKKD
jgi:hypothetical protein